MLPGPKRKHLVRGELRILHELTTLGVPLKKLIRERKLPISAPTVAILLKHYSRIQHPGLRSPADEATYESIFPPWLNHIGESVQTAPDNWQYDGLFPFGKWLEREIIKEL